jgi:hypothetical protein
VENFHPFWQTGAFDGLEIFHQILPDQFVGCREAQIFPFIQGRIRNDGPVHIFGSQLVNHRLLPLRRGGKDVAEIP